VKSDAEKKKRNGISVSILLESKKKDGDANKNRAAKKPIFLSNISLAKKYIKKIDRNAKTGSINLAALYETPKIK
jgi:protein involved in sex pheromone biosynthesis